jgi:hypothetical protein
MRGEPHHRTSVAIEDEYCFNVTSWRHVTSWKTQQSSLLSFWSWLPANCSSSVVRGGVTSQDFSDNTIQDRPRDPHRPWYNVYLWPNPPLQCNKSRFSGILHGDILKITWIFQKKRTFIFYIFSLRSQPPVFPFEGRLWPNFGHFGLIFMPNKLILHKIFHIYHKNMYIFGNPDTSATWDHFHFWAYIK